MTIIPWRCPQCAHLNWFSSSCRPCQVIAGMRVVMRYVDMAIRARDAVLEARKAQADVYRRQFDGDRWIN